MYDDYDSYDDNKSVESEYRYSDKRELRSALYNSFKEYEREIIATSHIKIIKHSKKSDLCKKMHF